MTLFDMTGKVAVITGSSRGIGRAIAERMAEHGAKVVISSRKQQVCDEVAEDDQRQGRQAGPRLGRGEYIHQGDLKHLVEETNRVFGKIDMLVCNAASNPYYGPLAGHLGRPVPQDPRQQHRGQPLADLDGGAADDRTQGRLHHHHLLDRGTEGLDGAWRLRDLESSRHAARAQSGLRIRQAQHPRQLHCPGPDQDRLRTGMLGESGDAESVRRRYAAVAHMASRTKSPVPLCFSLRPAVDHTGQTIVIMAARQSAEAGRSGQG